MKGRKNKPRFKLRTQEQMQEELAQITDEQERLKWFEQVVKDFDKVDALNDLKHYRKSRRHEFDPHWLDQDLDEEISIPPIFRTLNHSDGWLDYIFSRSPDDLHELVEDEAVSRALRGLSKERKEALSYRVVHGYSAEGLERSEAFLTAMYANCMRRQYRKSEWNLTNMGKVSIINNHQLHD